MRTYVKRYRTQAEAKRRIDLISRACLDMDTANASTAMAKSNIAQHLALDSPMLFRTCVTMVAKLLLIVVVVVVAAPPRSNAVEAMGLHRDNKAKTILLLEL